MISIDEVVKAKKRTDRVTERLPLWLQHAGVSFAEVAGIREAGSGKGVGIGETQDCMPQCGYCYCENGCCVDPYCGHICFCGGRC
jgi:hypothetical protein